MRTSNSRRTRREAHLNLHVSPAVSCGLARRASTAAYRSNPSLEDRRVRLFPCAVVVDKKKKKKTLSILILTQCPRAIRDQRIKKKKK